jgi:hypothetical protein
MVEIKTSSEFLSENLKRKSLGKPTRRGEDNIKINPKEIWC